MSVVGYRARNHPQQTAKRGPNSAVDDRATPPELFAMLNDRFRFTIDVAASPHNAKLDRYYTTEENGLTRPWAGERVWCNPPYSHPNIGRWLDKAWNEWRRLSKPELIVMLLPANRTEQKWWHQHVEPYRDRGVGLRTEFLPDRIRFLARGATAIRPNERPPFGCCLLIWEVTA